MQCENHEQFVQVALDYGWELWEYGTDTSCIVGGDAPHLALIWLKPCAWDESQSIPVGCLCCTNIEGELVTYAQELRGAIANRRLEIGDSARSHGLPDPYADEEPLEFITRPAPKAPPVNFLPPCRPR